MVFQNQNSRNSKSKFKKFTGNSQQKQIINQKRKQYYESADKERGKTRKGRDKERQKRKKEERKKKIREQGRKD